MKQRIGSLFILFLLYAASLKAQNANSEAKAFGEQSFAAALKSADELSGFYPELLNYIRFVESMGLSSNQTDLLKNEAEINYDKSRKNFVKSCRFMHHYLKEWRETHGSLNLAEVNVQLESDGTYWISWAIEDELEGGIERFRFQAFRQNAQWFILDGFYTNSQ